MTHIPRRGTLPLQLDGDVVVNRRDDRLAAVLSKPSPLHATPQTKDVARMDSGARALLSQIEVDDADDDVPLMERLNMAADAAIAPAPLFPFTGLGAVSDFRSLTVTHFIAALLSDLKNDAFVASAVWRDLWWTNIDADEPRRVVVNIAAYTLDLASASPLASTGAAKVKVAVNVDVVTAVVTRSGLCTCRVASVVTGTGESSGGDEFGAMVEVVGASATKKSAVSNADRCCFVRTDKAMSALLKPGQIVAAVVEQAYIRLLRGTAPKRADGEWMVSQQESVVDVASPEAEPTSPSDGIASPGAARKARIEKWKRKRAAMFDINLVFTPGPDSLETKAENRRQEAVRAAKAAGKKIARH